MHEMLQKLYAIANMKQKYSFEDLFNFEKFKEEEKKRKAAEVAKKKKRLESAVDVNDEGDSEEEEVERYEMPAKFVECGLEEEVTYETECDKWQITVHSVQSNHYF
ncbi:hypothetical protein Hanom_Chr05g00409661 [Helianthus anomalus]